MLTVADQILTNLILLVTVSCFYLLQRLCYGPLRPIEVEQLYEKAWFAITETCLAMTIFREEVGAWFLVMFVALLAGKVWGWIGEGRVEVLEQQPPANPRLFHARLSSSLALSLIYDISIMSYTVNTVIQQARPNMMVMFLFEFAILTTSSFSTALRYCISLIEANITKQQTQERLAARRTEVREAREEAIRQRDANASADGEGNTPAPVDLPAEEDIEEMDIEVSGWEAKGQWILTLDLLTGRFPSFDVGSNADLGWARPLQARHLWHLFLHSAEFLWSAHTHNARSIPYRSIFCQTSHCIFEISAGYSRYEPTISGRDG